MQKTGAGTGVAELPERRLSVDPLSSMARFKEQAYAAIRSAIAAMDVYRNRADIRLDERRLAQDFGISRTPVREAMAQLEREGFVRSEPRRGVYVVRKTKREVIELITAWAALESMAARLITENAGDEDIAALRRMFATFENGEVGARTSTNIPTSISSSIRRSSA
jgi:DNA-binding GntR family transcriptional regulator